MYAKCKSNTIFIGGDRIRLSFCFHRSEFLFWKRYNWHYAKAYSLRAGGADWSWRFISIGIPVFGFSYYWKQKNKFVNKFKHIDND